MQGILFACLKPLKVRMVYSIACTITCNFRISFIFPVVVVFHFYLSVLVSSALKKYRLRILFVLTYNLS